jgi:hypothetical protein
MESLNLSEVDIANLSGYQDSNCPMNSLNGSAVTLTQNNNTNNTNTNPTRLSLNKMRDKANVDSAIFNDQVSRIVKPSNSCKNFLYCTITCSVISYVLFIISLSLPKWQSDYSYFQPKKNILSSGVDTCYMIIIMIITIIDFIFLLFLLRLNRFYRKTYYAILVCFAVLVLLKLIFEVVYLIKINYKNLGSSFWLFTASVLLDLLSLFFYLGLIKIYEHKIKSFRLNKQLEDFKKSGFDSGMIDSVTLVGSTGSQSQTQLAYNVNKSIPEKNILNYQNQRVSVASLTNQSLLNNAKIDSHTSNSEYINKKNIQSNNTSLPYSVSSGIKNVNGNGNGSNSDNNSNNRVSSSNINNVSLQRLSNIPINQNSNSIINNNNNNITKISPVENMNNIKGTNIESNENIPKENYNNESNVQHHSNSNLTSKIEITSKSSPNSNSNSSNHTNDINKTNVNIKSNIRNSMTVNTNNTDKVIRSTVRPKRDSSLIINASFSNGQLQVPVKSSSDNKRVSNANYMEELEEINTSKSQIIELTKNNISDKSDKKSSFVLNNTGEPIYSQDIESLHDIESFEEGSSVNKVKQTNSIPTTNSSSTPSKPKSQPPSQQYSILPQPSLQQRPQSYQCNNNNNKVHDNNIKPPYNVSLDSKKSPTTIDDYVPLAHYLNSPSSSQVARKSQRDSLLNQIFGTNNDSHSYVSMTAINDKTRKETYQSFDQLTPLENHHRPTDENLSLTKVPKDIPNDISFEIVNGITNEIPNESFSQTLCHSNMDSYSQSYYLSNSNSNMDDSLFETLSYSQGNSIGGQEHSAKIITDKDLTQDPPSISKSQHTSSIYDKGANINKYSVKSLQLKTDVPLNNLDPALNERINSITVNRYVNEEKVESSKETNFDILASSSMTSNYNPKEKEFIQDPYYMNTSYYEKIPYYEKVEEYKGGSEGKDSIVSSLSISSSSSSSLNTSDSSLKEHYKKYGVDRKKMHSPTKNSSSHHSQDLRPQECDLSEPPAEEEKEDYVSDYYQTKDYLEYDELNEAHSHRHSNGYSYSRQPPTPSSFEQSHNNYEQQNQQDQQNHALEMEDHHSGSYVTGRPQNEQRNRHYNNNNNNNSQANKKMDRRNENIINDDEKQEEEQKRIKSYYNERSYEQEQGHHNHHDQRNYHDNHANHIDHRSPSIISYSTSSSSSFKSSEEAAQPIHNNINYEREEDDYENQKPPVTVVTIPPLSPFELPAIAIPFTQPDPREVGDFSPIITTQPTLTTKPTSYTLNNHLSIPYDHSRSFMNDFTAPSSYKNSIIK